MKTLVFFLLLPFTTSESFAQANKSNRATTSVSHFRNNISVKNFDGTHATIYVNGSTATLVNSDGTQSTIDFCENSSTLIAIDGTSSSVFHNGLSSTISSSDGTQFIVNHMRNTSLCSTKSGKHTINHNFGHLRERRYKNEIDVLIHRNWLIQKKIVDATEATVELNRK